MNNDTQPKDKFADLDSRSIHGAALPLSFKTAVDDENS